MAERALLLVAAHNASKMGGTSDPTPESATSLGQWSARSSRGRVPELPFGKYFFPTNEVRAWGVLGHHANRTARRRVDSTPESDAQSESCWISASWRTRHWDGRAHFEGRRRWEGWRYFPWSSCSPVGQKCLGERGIVRRSDFRNAILVSFRQFF